MENSITNSSQKSHQTPIKQVPQTELINTLDSSNFLLSPPAPITIEELEAMDKTRAASFISNKKQYTFQYNNGASYCTVLYEGDLPDGLSQEEQKKFSPYTIQKDGQDIVYYRYKTHPDMIETVNSSTGLGLRKNYHMADKLSYKPGETHPSMISTHDIIEYIKSKKIVFYTGAGISMASGIFDMKGLVTSLGINQKEDTDNFIHNILAEPSIVLEKFGQFCDVAFHGDPTPAHVALAKIATKKGTTICTENFDRLQERTGIKVYHISGDDMTTRYKPEYFKEIDAIICIGLSHDDRGLLGWYKQHNPEGKIIALDLQQPEYLGNEDYLLQGDAQKLLPEIQSQYFNSSNSTMSTIPDSINTQFKIEEEKLRAMEIPVETIDITELANNFDIPYLEQLGTDDWNLSPRMLIENFDKETHHAGVVQKADLQYPIEIYFFKGQWIIIDGVHRFTKAMMQGDTTIKVRRISDEVVNQVKKSEADYRRWKGETV